MEIIDLKILLSLLEIENFIKLFTSENSNGIIFPFEMSKVRKTEFNSSQLLNKTATGPDGFPKSFSSKRISFLLGQNCFCKLGALYQQQVFWTRSRKME